MNSKKITRLVHIALMLVFVLVLRLFQLQFLESEYWERQAISSRLEKDTIPFKRGGIFFRDGQVAAEDKVVYDLNFRYRDFRRGHPVGQLHAAFDVLGWNERGQPSVGDMSLLDCLDRALLMSEKLLALKPRDLSVLSSRDRDDLTFYLKRLFGVDNKVQKEKFLEWFDTNQDFLVAFPDSAIFFENSMRNIMARHRIVESLLVVPEGQSLLELIESRRKNLKRLIYHRSLQDIAAQALGLEPSTLRNNFRDSKQRLADAHYLHHLWDLDGRAEYLAALLAPAEDIASHQLEDLPLNQQIKLLENLWEQVRALYKGESAETLRRQSYRAHRFRTIRFSKDIFYDLVDLIAQEPDFIPGLYVQKSTRRIYPLSFNPLLVGRVQLPNTKDLIEYRSLNDRFQELRRQFYRSAKDEASYRQLRHRLWSKTLRPDETRGLAGLEKAFENVMRGTRGYLQVLEGGEKGELPLELLYSAPTHGKDIVLSLNPSWNSMAEKAIENAYNNVPADLANQSQHEVNLNNPKVGFAIIDLENGGIPVLVSTPTLNREKFNSDYGEMILLRDGSPLRHRALAGNYWPKETPYPGSTFKPLVAAAALLKDMSFYDRKYHCAGLMTIEETGSTLSCDTTYGHQDISMREALKKSCNIYFYKLAAELGAEAIHSLATELGFGDLTGVEVPDLERGAPYLSDLNSLKKNSIRLMRTAIGQVGVQASPLQMARFYGWLAVNRLVSPSLIDFSPSAIKAAPNFKGPQLSKSQQEKITDSLLSVSYEFGGTAFETGFSSDFEVAAKTGTAQVAASGSLQPTHAWFAGYFPASKPRYAFAIMCENAGLHGGEIASYVLKEFLELIDFSK